MHDMTGGVISSEKPPPRLVHRSELSDPLASIHLPELGAFDTAANYVQGNRTGKNTIRFLNSDWQRLPRVVEKPVLKEGEVLRRQMNTLLSDRGMLMEMRKWESFAPLTHGQIFQTIGMSTMRARIPHVALLSPTSLPERAPATLIYWFLIPGGVLIGEKEACLDERWNSHETARLRWDEGTVMHGLRVNR